MPTTRPIITASAQSPHVRYSAPQSRKCTVSVFMGVAHQPYFAAFPLAFEKGFGALPALMAAHRFLAASAIAFRAAALSVRFPSTTG